MGATAVDDLVKGHVVAPSDLHQTTLPQQAAGASPCLLRRAPA
jgi:hypothetical protein